jgi:AraC family transcriptional regulator, arabinose operon regulatory protein
MPALDTTQPFDCNNILPAQFCQEWVTVSRNLYDDGRDNFVGCLFHNRAKSSKALKRMCYNNKPITPPQNKKGVYGISYALAGDAIMLEDDKIEHRLTPGCVFHIYTFPPWDRWRCLPKSNFFDCSIYFDNATGYALEQLGILQSIPTVLPGVLQPALVLKFRDLFESIRGLSVPSLSILRQAIGVLDFIYTQVPMTMSDTWLTRACALLREHPEPSFTMQEAAAHLKLPYNYFRRKFKELKKMSPRAFQVQERMSYARELITRQSVKDVARILGYNDAYTFSKQFKQCVGINPSVFYRLSNRHHDDS